MIYVCDFKEKKVLITDLSGRVFAADRCMVRLLTALWRVGVRTRMHCCGHGLPKQRRIVFINRNDISKAKRHGWKVERSGKGKYVGYIVLPDVPHKRFAWFWACGEHGSPYPASNNCAIEYGTIYDGQVDAGWQEIYDNCRRIRNAKCYAIVATMIV